jgi:phosphoribosylformimino-5-aminoimidazole carboxamide ribotide isomerase
VVRLTTPFELLPAIDVLAGRVVRLEQGDVARQTVYSDDPAKTARDLIDGGANWLHVVDLDGAQAGRPVQATVVERIVAAAGDGARVEAAGGLRTPDAVAAILDAGAGRAVIGTAALVDDALVGKVIREHGADRIVVAVDVRDGRAVGEGWRIGAAGVPPDELILRLAYAGVETFEVTAIDRDGLRRGPDLDLLARLVDLGRGRIIAAGGIGSIGDLEAVGRLGCTGAIVGRALYDGSLTIRAAVDAMAAVDRLG